MNRVVLRYELLALLRDTRTILLSVLLPIILLPVLLLTMGRMSQRVTGELDVTYHYAHLASAEGLQPILAEALDTGGFREMLVEDPDAMLREGHIDLLIRVGSAEKVDKKGAQDVAQMFPVLGKLIDKQKPGIPVIELVYRGDRDRSVRAFMRATDELTKYRNGLVGAYLQEHSIGQELKLVATDESTPAERAARRYGPALSAFMVLILLGGGSVAALDSLAGERERGTLSTLFVSSMRRRDIAWSKFWAVAIISVVVALLQVFNLLGYTWLGLVDWPIESTPGQGVATLLALFSLFVSEAVFTAALLLYISARSKTFKEAQLFFFPTFLVAFALSLSGLVPSLVSRSVISLIPLSGPGVLIPEILAGRQDGWMLALQLFVHLAAAYLLVNSTITLMEREDFLGGEPPAFGEDLKFAEFSDRALPYFALLGAALFVIPSNFEALTALKGQVLFNQLILFGLGPYLLLRWYRQPFTRAVPVKRLSLPILLSTLALIPLGQLAATGLSQLLGPLLPAPVKALEMMAEMLDVEHTPAWALYLLIGVLPGLFEEFAFRGVLLHALHKRYGPWRLALLVALVFGFFHLNFFRVLPTAYLGFFLTLLTLATGSIVPAVIVHIGNNSLAVWAMLHSLDFDGLPTWVYGVGLLGQVVLLAFVYRVGDGYPGTRWSKEKRIANS